MVDPLPSSCLPSSLTKQTAHAAPVSSLAREIGLPTWIVDIRHEAAHKQVGWGCQSRIFSRISGPRMELVKIPTNDKIVLYSRYRFWNFKPCLTPSLSLVGPSTSWLHHGRIPHATCSDYDACLRVQLPGIVTLRLAADFLVDYLWRRYWGPQAEHLSFVWGAFDQLLSR